MTRRAIGPALSLLLGWTALAPVAAAATAPLPDRMVAVGDSITQAASTVALGADAPQNSWSTGTSASVNSHYLRLLAAGAPISGQNYNRSVSGAKVADLAGQMTNAGALAPDYVTVLIGGNDLCTDTVASMTSVADFRARFETAMSTLATASPDTYVYVVSIPNVYQLWNLFRNNFWARLIWASAGICQSLLANPGSTQAADVQRRETVRQRNIDFNAQLAAVCAQYARCLFDGNAAFNTTFTSSDVSGDYFHPSVAGQAKLAAVTWNAGFTFGTQPPANQPPTAAFSASCTALSCAFTNASTDGDGSIAASSWTFGDGATSTATSPSHAYASAATYTVSLTVTDDDGATSTTSQAVTVTAPPADAPMWVAGLSASASGTRNTWTATATVTIASETGPVAGAAVSGRWGSTSGSCTTGSGGTCTISASMNKKTTTATFTLIAVSKAGFAWDPALGPTSVSVSKP